MDDTLPQRAESRPPSGSTQTPGSSQFNPADPQFVHREHVTGALPAHPSEAPLFRPANAPYPAFPGYQAPQQAYPPSTPGSYPRQQQQGQGQTQGYAPSQA